MKKIWLTLIFLVNATSCLANSDWTDAFETMWEMQWHQSGYPVNARKLYFIEDKKLTYSITPNVAKRHLEYINEAIEKISIASSIEFIQAEENTPKVQVEFVIKRFTDDELRQYACFMRPTEKNFLITHAEIVMSEQQSFRCPLHELMHAMGFMGHPTGDTVLTYFGQNYSKLSDTDKFVLKKWYATPRFILPGMNIFRVIVKLNRRWIKENVPIDQQAQAIEVEKQWFLKMIAQMDVFADAGVAGDSNSGKSEPPLILYRSGKLTSEGLKFSRIAIQGLLGVAYLEGFGVVKNPVRAYDLLMRGSQAGLVEAIDSLFQGLALNKFLGVDVKPACIWLKDRLQLAKRMDLIKQNEKLVARSCGDSFSPGNN
jgi:hypothetical protein